MIKYLNGLLGPDEKGNFLNGSLRSKEAPKKVASITFCYLDFDLAKLLKGNHRKNRHNARIYTRDGLSV